MVGAGRCVGIVEAEIYSFDRAIALPFRGFVPRKLRVIAYGFAVGAVCFVADLGDGSVIHRLVDFSGTIGRCWLLARIGSWHIRHDVIQRAGHL